MDDVMSTENGYRWSETLVPRLLKSPWWIGHIPFAYELIGRLRPSSVVELGTYSGSSFAAFCQVMNAAGISGKCYGIDLWEGDIHMGRFDESLYQEINGYVTEHYPEIAVLVRKDFNAAASDFEAGSVDLLHIDGTHTYEAVRNDFMTWLPKLSDRGVVLFHDTNVTVEKAGEAALRFGVRRFFDEVKKGYTHFEFDHCWGLGVLVVGRNVPDAVLALVAPGNEAAIKAYFATKGDAVMRQYEALGLALPQHGNYLEPQGAEARKANEGLLPWRRLRAQMGRLTDSARRLFG
jgi:predicted O-methyltransferase YrrM